MAAHVPTNPDFTPEKSCELDERIKALEGRIGATIKIMAEAQQLFGYLPEEAMAQIAHGLGVPPADVFGIATFYAYFRTSPPARNTITSCQGTACYVSGGKEVLDELERRLEIKRGETTLDREFSIQSVRCIGACALAPVIKINDNIYSRVTPRKIPGILSRYAALHRQGKTS
ncbi:MAG: NAD(P)H-dependent oxidoreductase subunit E [Desulfobacterales bacterium]